MTSLSFQSDIGCWTSNVEYRILEIGYCVICLRLTSELFLNDYWCNTYYCALHLSIAIWRFISWTATQKNAHSQSLSITLITCLKCYGTHDFLMSWPRRGEDMTGLLAQVFSGASAALPLTLPLPLPLRLLTRSSTSTFYRPQPVSRWAQRVDRSGAHIRDFGTWEVGNFGISELGDFGTLETVAIWSSRAKLTKLGEVGEVGEVGGVGGFRMWRDPFNPLTKLKLIQFNFNFNFGFSFNLSFNSF